MNDCLFANTPCFTTNSLFFGIFTFGIILAILVLDRTQLFVDKFNYSKAMDGYFEGYFLLFLTFFWLFGIGYLTGVKGVAFFSLNIYLSSWLVLFSCVFTLDKWSGSKDILTIKELTGLSYTLKWWYILLFSSFVVMAASANMYTHIDPIYGTRDRADCIFGIVFGLFSMVLSVVFIFVHYKIFECCSQGGWVEASFAFVLIIIWLTAVFVITMKESGIGTTISGTGCSAESFIDFDTELGDGATIQGCSILMEKGTQTEVSTCRLHVTQRVPGSNLFLSTWACFIASMNIAFRWKTQQAIKFVERAQKEQERNVEIVWDEEDDSDSDVFKDASY